MTRNQLMTFNPETLLVSIGRGKKTLSIGKGNSIFSQGDAADAVFYIQEGKVKLSVVSPKGKEAVVAILGPRDFFGEACLATQSIRLASATTVGKSTIVRIDKTTMIRMLHDDPTFSETFLAHVLSRNMRIEENVVDLLFNSSEKRLARALLLMAHIGKNSKPEPALAKVSQETLAEMIGTTRSRVSFFMNKFRKLGFIEYNGHLTVHSTLLNVVLHD